MKKAITILLIIVFTPGVFSQVPENWVGKVMTVRGLIAPESMGITLPHEHLLIVHKFNYLDLTDEATAITELGYFADAGGKTLADASAIGIGRNPEGLKRISEATGINVIMCAGYYKDLWIPDSIKNKSIAQLAETIISDIKTGVRGIHAGFIKIAISKPITPFEEKVVRAAAIAQKATGTAIEVHFDGDHASAEEKHHVLNVFENEGVDLTRVILCHSVPYLGLVDDFITLAQRGCQLSFDMQGLEVRVAFEGEQKLAETFNALIDAGYLDQLLISQDVCFSVCYVKNGGYGYAHILNNILPQLRAGGITDAQIHTIMVDNPKRVFPFKNYEEASLCGDETFTAMTGTVTDNSGNAAYHNNMVCEKLIQPSGALNVTLTFNSFATESGYDFVKIYDGTTTSSPLLGKFSGTSLPPSITSSGASMLIEFTTDGGVVAAGWSATYKGNAPSLHIAPGSRQVSPGSGTVTFTVRSNIDWSASESSGWLSTTRANDTTLSVSFDENKITAPRSAEITVGGEGVASQIIMINQDGAIPFLDISPETRQVSPASGTEVFTVTSNVDWSVNENSGWLTATKTDDTTLTVSYNENKITDPRSAQITVSGAGTDPQQITVSQNGANPFLSVTPDSKPVSTSSGTIDFSVASNIDWSVSENSDWLTAIKTNDSILTVVYDENFGVDLRSAEIVLSVSEVISQIVTVSQKGVSRALAISPESEQVGPASGTTTFTVTSNIEWSVSESSDWLTATKADMTTLSVSYDENTDPDERSAEITISGEGVNSRTVIILQEGAIPSNIGLSSENSRIRIFPNPVFDKTWLSYPEGTAERIEIYEPSGRLVIRMQITDNDGKTEVDFSGLNSGLYLYRLVDRKGNTWNGKILKK